MTYPTIETVEDLRSYMDIVSEKDVTDRNLFWFVCMFNARMIFDSYSTKDLAGELLEGIKPTNELSQVQEFIDTFHEDVSDDDDKDASSLPLVAAVLNFYGKYDEEQQVLQMME